MVKNITKNTVIRPETRVVDYRSYVDTNKDGEEEFITTVYFADGESVTLKCDKYDEDRMDLRKLFSYAIAKKSNPQFLSDVDYAMKVPARKAKKELKEVIQEFEQKRIAERKKEKNRKRKEKYLRRKYAGNPYVISMRKELTEVAKSLARITELLNK